MIVIDLPALHDAGILVPGQVRSALAEQFRHLKRPLLRNARSNAEGPEHPGTLIQVTSALPGEGKTYCAINLAMSMAMEVDTGVILVDADVIRPSVFARLGVESTAPGLLDLLTRTDLALPDALISTNVPKLTLMGAGNPSLRSTELLASAAMDRLLRQLATEYADHVVIFDAPPLLLTSESVVLASKVGQVVMVVESGATRQDSVREAFVALRHCPVVLSVLNKCDEQTGKGRYGYYER
ncbi:MAG: chromosome partitioning ATPase [Aquabacterium sp.]